MEHKEIYERWLASPYLSEDEKRELREMSDGDIYEAFYKRLEFGTAGMRGIMGLGTNRMNRHTIGMATRGFAEYLGRGAKVAVAYDTRHNSKEYAEEAAGILAAAGLKAMLFDRFSPVPLLSFAVRHLGCDGGIVITASHNTKIYNGFKVYDRTGCQLGEEDATKVADIINASPAEPSAPAVLASSSEVGNGGSVSYIGDEVIESFLEAVGRCGVEVSREAKEDLGVIYTSLHGSGREYVLETLKRAGFTDVTLVGEQADYNGDFPTVEKPNPEDTAVFGLAEKLAERAGADIPIGTDPDSDRIGVGVRKVGQTSYLSGNQIGTLLVDFLTRKRKPAAGGKLLTTIVTGDMGPVVAESRGIGVIRTFTGFKNLGAEMNRLSDDEILMAYEESYGYLTGTHIRDKDGISSALLICEMAAYWKEQGKTLADVLDELYEEYGYYMDGQGSFVFEGAEGVKVISSIMEHIRKEAEGAFTDIGEVRELKDYSLGIDGMPAANVIKYMFTNGSWLAVRPSGTEPKIKFYYCVRGEDRKDAEAIYDRAVKSVKALVSQNLHR